MPFSFTPTEKLPEVIVITSQRFPDDRGFFQEIFKESDFAGKRIIYNFKQDAYSVSGRGVIRGLHYQLPPSTQGKLVGVITGRIWDVAVDIRKSSPTYKQWVGVELSEENRQSLYLPPGFAHGFIALEDSTRVIYKLSEEYSPELDRGIRYDDPQLSISWPDINPIISEKDRAFPFLSEAEIF